MRVNENDPLFAKLVTTGLVGNPGLFKMRGEIQAPAAFCDGWPWNLPSRVFQNPILADSDKGECHLYLAHPRLADHPFVHYAEMVLGREIPRTSGDAVHTRLRGARWFHALDMIKAGNWQDLLKTGAFTDRGLIFRAVHVALLREADDVAFDAGDAHGLLLAMNSAEPEDRDGLVRMVFCGPREDGATVVIRSAIEEETRAWAAVTAIEDGWMTTGVDGVARWTLGATKRFAIPAPANNDPDPQFAIAV